MNDGWSPGCGIRLIGSVEHRSVMIQVAEHMWLGQPWDCTQMVGTVITFVNPSITSNVNIIVILLYHIIVVTVVLCILQCRYLILSMVFTVGYRLLVIY
jgi:hypothetical protein